MLQVKSPRWQCRSVSSPRRCAGRTRSAPKSSCTWAPPSGTDPWCCITSPRSIWPAGCILGFEALVRWPHPTQGLLQPERVHRHRRGHQPGGRTGALGHRDRAAGNSRPGTTNIRGTLPRDECQRLAGPTDHPGLRHHRGPDPRRMRTRRAVPDAGDHRTRAAPRHRAGV